MTPIKIAPSILSADFSHLAKQVREAEDAGVDYIHVDVMDGHFVPNITIGPLIVKALRPITKLPLDVHLMIENPERYIEDFSKAGADIITVHQETCPHLHSTIQQIHDLDIRAGVSINPSTPVSTLDEIISEVDLVLVMSVNPGFGGQSYIASCTGKIKKLREMLDQCDSSADLQWMEVSMLIQLMRLLAQEPMPLLPVLQSLTTNKVLQKMCVFSEIR